MAGSIGALDCSMQLDLVYNLHLFQQACKQLQLVSAYDCFQIFLAFVVIFFPSLFLLLGAHLI